MGDPATSRNFMGAVIDKGAFDTIKGYIDRSAKRSRSQPKILAAAAARRKGYFIEPTVVEAKDPTSS